MIEPKPTIRGRRLKRRILALLAALLVFVVGVFLSSVYVIEQRTRQAGFQASVAAVQTSMHQRMETATGLMRAVTAALFANQDMAAALAAQDRVALARRAGPVFAGLRRDHGVTHLYFTQPDLVNLLRLHDHDHHGDLIDRHTTRRAAATGDTVSGIELGPLGTLTLRSVAPWRWQRETIGYVELGMEIEPILTETATSLSVHLFAFVDKARLDRERWERGQALLGRATAWAAWQDHVLAARSHHRMLPDTESRLVRTLSGRADDAGIARLPLRDAGGQIIGQLVVIDDRGDDADTFAQWLTLATLLSVGAGTVVFVLFSRSLAVVENDYRRQHDLEHRLLRISSEQQRLVQVEKLSAVGRMIGEIAHQLNNPLVGVVSMAQLADRSVGDPERLRPLLADIRKAGQDCSLFVKRMLDFTKASCFDRKPGDLCAILDEALALFRQSGGQRVAVETRLPDQPANLAVDAILMRHVLFNLLTNAAQAMGGHGHVLVTLDRSTDQDGRPGWRLVVEDDGPGLSPEVMDHLFIPFFTTHPEGTGLGLAVVMHIVLLHDGTVEGVNRTDGCSGARFALWLPEDA